MRLAAALLLLSTFAYTVVPVHAQDRQENARRLLRDVRETDRTTSNSAREWAARRGLPTRIRQSDGRIVELVAVDDGRPVYLTAANRSAAAISGTSHLYPGGKLGLSLTGAGLALGIWDEGHALVDHVEISSRIKLGDKADVSDHATHVAGTLAASGVDDRARGMAYESLLTSYDWNNDATEMSNEAANGLLVSNHSYTSIAGWHYGDVEGTGEDQWYWLGDPGISSVEDAAFGTYDIRAVQYDRVTYTNPYYLPVVASGNDRLDDGPASGTYRALNASGKYQDYNVSQRPITRDGGSEGFDTISGGSVAKNVLTVGSAGFSSRTNTVFTSAFSSFGPTDDGRVKPDLAGIGEDVYSLSSKGTSKYARWSGTSMAAPTVTGSLLLLQQQYEEIYGAFMRSATLKGVVLHTATDLGRAGPDYETGWGLLNTEEASRQISASAMNTIGIHEDQLVDGAAFTRNVVVQTRGPLRITLSWTDHPSTRLPVSGAASLDNPTAHLRNDLDVRLVNLATGDVYLPYTLDPSQPSSPAIPGDNVLDPLEQIFITAADTGSYAIVVSHKRTLYGGFPQSFSIIVSGAVDDSAPVAVSHMNAEVSPDGIRLTWKTLFERTDGTFVVERAPGGSLAAKGSSDDAFVAVGELSAGSSETEYSFLDPNSIAGRYVYRLLFENGNDVFEAARTDVNLPAPTSYAVLSNYPNPFRDHTTIEVDLPKTQDVRVSVFDLLGRRLVALHDGTLPAGRHRMVVSGGNWPAGVYFARVDTPNGVVTHRMVLVR